MTCAPAAHDRAMTAATLPTAPVEAIEAYAATRVGLCTQANGLLLTGVFAFLQECQLPDGHTRQAHRNHAALTKHNASWRGPALSGQLLAVAQNLRGLVQLGSTQLLITLED